MKENIYLFSSAVIRTSLNICLFFLFCFSDIFQRGLARISTRLWLNWPTSWSRTSRLTWFWSLSSSWPPCCSRTTIRAWRRGRNLGWSCRSSRTERCGWGICLDSLAPVFSGLVPFTPQTLCPPAAPQSHCRLCVLKYSDQQRTQCSDQMKILMFVRRVDNVSTSDGIRFFF